jgi:Fur family ferric uptake transcriptional regulator
MKRNTWQREALGDTAGFVSAQSLHQAMREHGSEVGLATVYRALASLATEGEADSLQQEGESLYRACTPGRHHHHLICRRCGTTVEIEADPVEQWAREIAAANGFTQPEHVVDVFGYCAACTAQLAT